MGIDVQGFIEVRYDSENDLLSKWKGLIPISSLVVHCDVDASVLFGISRDGFCKNPVASERGLPTDASLAVLEALESYREFEKEESNFSFDELFGFTFLNYQEILDSDLIKKLDGNQWKTVFSLMKVLHKSGIYEAVNIRLVVWAIW